MKTRRILAALVCAALALTACGGEKPVDPAAAKTAVQALELDGETPFKNFYQPDDAYITTVMGIDTSLLSDYAVLVSNDDLDPCMVLLLVPAQGQRDAVKNAVSESLVNYQRRWDNYLPEQAVLVSDRLETEVGDCIVAIISTDNDTVLETIRNA
ncbi:MAG: DUF4358 domain-containing protein [Oscillospiraceae bacterium]|nr:DUF4358 domain-containing protein [Oscillospiraceae bacterium]